MSDDDTDDDVSWNELLLVCRKCDGTRDGVDARCVRKAVKRELGKKGHGLRVMEVDCLKLCPKDALTYVRARTAGPGAELGALHNEGELDALLAKIRLTARVA